MHVCLYIRSMRSMHMIMHTVYGQQYELPECLNPSASLSPYNKYASYHAHTQIHILLFVRFLNSMRHTLKTHIHRRQRGSYAYTTTLTEESIDISNNCNKWQAKSIISLVIFGLIALLPRKKNSARLVHRNCRPWSAVCTNATSSVCRTSFCWRTATARRRSLTICASDSKRTWST